MLEINKNINSETRIKIKAEDSMKPLMKQLIIK